MLHVKSCNVKHNSERVFCYFASAVNSNYRVQHVIEKIFLLSVVILALKSWLCSTAPLLQIVVWFTANSLLKSPCTAHQPDRIHPISPVSIINIGTLNVHELFWMLQCNLTKSDESIFFVLNLDWFFVRNWVLPYINENAKRSAASMLMLYIHFPLPFPVTFGAS